MIFYLLLALLWPAKATADCLSFSKRAWGCKSLFCVIVDAISVPVAGIPKYESTLGDGHVRNGLGWEFVIAVPPQSNACLAWEQDFSLEFSWYPWVAPASTDSSYKVQTTWRTWIPTNLIGNRSWGLRLGGGAGAFVGLGGAGPRIEARLWAGEIEDSVRIFGFFVSTAYEPDLVKMRQRAAFAAGIEMPLQI